MNQFFDVHVRHLIGVNHVTIWFTITIIVIYFKIGEKIFYLNRKKNGIVKIEVTKIDKQEYYYDWKKYE